MATKPKVIISICMDDATRKAWKSFKKTYHMPSLSSTLEFLIQDFMAEVDEEAVDGIMEVENKKEEDFN